MPNPTPSLDLHCQPHGPQECEQARGEALPRNLYGHCHTPKGAQPRDDWDTGVLVSCFVFFKSTEEGVCVCVCVYREREGERREGRREGWRERVSNSRDIVVGTDRCTKNISFSTWILM